MKSKVNKELQRLDKEIEKVEYEFKRINDYLNTSHGLLKLLLEDSMI